MFWFLILQLFLTPAYLFTLLLTDVEMNEEYYGMLLVYYLLLNSKLNNYFASFIFVFSTTWYSLP